MCCADSFYDDFAFLRPEFLSEIERCYRLGLEALYRAYPLEIVPGPKGEPLLDLLPEWTNDHLIVLTEAGLTGREPSNDTLDDFIKERRTNATSSAAQASQPPLHEGEPQEGDAKDTEDEEATADSDDGAAAFDMAEVSRMLSGLTHRRAAAAAASTVAASSSCASSSDPAGPL